jgi:hypothetical protein
MSGTSNLNGVGFAGPATVFKQWDAPGPLVPRIQELLNDPSS